MRILIVDDSRAMRMIVKRALRQAGYGDHTVEEAANGREARKPTQASTPALVLADWNMPEMSGIELLEALRAEGTDVKFGFVTSQATPEKKETARKAGALFLLTKPFTPDSLKTALDRVLG